MRYFPVTVGLLASGVLLVLPSCQGTSTTEKSEQLGEAIFSDPRLSANANQSCAACHHGDVGWTGPDEQVNLHSGVYEGSIAGRKGDRKPPASAYATFAPVLTLDESGQPVGGNFWDARATGWKLGSPAADQAQGPFLNPVEQALADPAAVVTLVCAASYGALFREVWGSDACSDSVRGFDGIARSIADFEGSSAVSAFDSKYDAFVAGRATLSDVEQQGLALFEGKAKCANCHATTPDATGHRLFTDFTFDNIGVPSNPELSRDGADPGLGGFLQKLATDDSWRALPHVSAPFEALSSDALKALAQQSLGKQRVPTLRNVDKRPSAGFVKAYMHDAYFKSLEAVVHFYNTRDVLPRCGGSTPPTSADVVGRSCWPAPETADNLNTTEVGNLGLNADEEAALVAFLRTLSDGVR
jgi:cytochrome c peroxidase